MSLVNLWCLNIFNFSINEKNQNNHLSFSHKKPKPYHEIWIEEMDLVPFRQITFFVYFNYFYTLTIKILRHSFLRIFYKTPCVHMLWKIWPSYLTFSPSRFAWYFTHIEKDTINMPHFLCSSRNRHCICWASGNYFTSLMIFYVLVRRIESLTHCIYQASVIIHLKYQTTHTYRGTIVLPFHSFRPDI